MSIKIQHQIFSMSFHTGIVEMRCWNMVRNCIINKQVEYNSSCTALLELPRECTLWMESEASLLLNRPDDKAETLKGLLSLYNLHVNLESSWYYLHKRPHSCFTFVLAFRADDFWSSPEKGDQTIGAGVASLAGPSWQYHRYVNFHSPSTSRWFL